MLVEVCLQIAALASPATSYTLRPWSYALLFEGDDASLSDFSKVILKQVVADFASLDQITLEVVGHYDQGGSPESRIESGKHIAVVVANYLIDDGVPANVISISSVGYAQSLSGPPDAPAPGKRWVEVIVTSHDRIPEIID